MVRPRKNRTVAFSPDVSYFKPRGIPLRRLDEVRLTVDELEAIRLSDWMGLSQEEAGRRMKVSRATFGRIIQKARNLVADALVTGKAIRIEGGSYTLSARGFQLVCQKCRHEYYEPATAGADGDCPKCRQKKETVKEGRES